MRLEHHDNLIEVETIIIGAGLSGLMIAWRLQQAGRQALILEARDRLGGRIFSTNVGDHAFDLGPAWFWEDHHNVKRLLGELGLESFDQFETGHAIFDHGPQSAPQRFVAPPMPHSYRFVGGVRRLIDSVAAHLPKDWIVFDTVAQVFEQREGSIQIAVKQGEQSHLYQAKHVIVTLPPRLIIETLQFTPALPDKVVQAMQQTQTWMGQAMKAVLVYETPFWREQGLSGLGISHVGPINQFHDLTPGDETYGAIFGWLGDHSFGRRLSFEERQQAVIAQAVRLFGPQAQQPIHYADLNWAKEPFTTMSTTAQTEHPRYGHPLLQKPQMAGRLHWASTEVSPVNGGYLDGAIYIGEQVAKRVIAGAE